MFKVLDTCLQNTGKAYEVTAPVGDCFCSYCGLMVKMHEPISGDYFFGQCECGHYVEALILLDKNGLCGCWIERDDTEIEEK